MWSLWRRQRHKRRFQKADGKYDGYDTAKVGEQHDMIDEY